MNAKEILKEAFDSDVKVLDTAFEHDKELATIAFKQITDLIAKIGLFADILVQKGVLTETEALDILKVKSEDITNEED